MLYSGACHCGQVSFEFDAPDVLEVEECNCSICSKSGYLHIIIPKRMFKLLSGEQDLITYTFNTKVAQHFFCAVCGIKPFYIPRSNPDGVDVNLRCVEPIPTNIRIVKFDGVNWEKNAHTLAYKTHG
jgi:hypothetical protein